MARPASPIVVIGAGLAGLSAAIAAEPRRVIVLSAGTLGQDCASAWAQGGIAAALSHGRQGERMRDGVRVVLAGAPNAGKSSLFASNAGNCSQ